MAVGDQNLRLITRLMDAAALRHEVLTHNLANQNTPGFKRSDVDFETLIAKAHASGKGDVGAIQPEVRVDEATPAGPDGNNVNLELELNAVRENQLLFDTYAGIMKANFDILHTSIRTR